jgi:hypothetical protein
LARTCGRRSRRTCGPAGSPSIDHADAPSVAFLPFAIYGLRTTRRPSKSLYALFVIPEGNLRL